MPIIFELSLEHESLPKAEVLSCLLAQDVDFEVLDEDQGILVVKAPKGDLRELRNRLALTHTISDFLFSCEASELHDYKGAIEIGEGTFAVRAKRLMRLNPRLDIKKAEKIIADLVEGDNSVDLENPEIEIRLIVSNRCYGGISREKIPRSSFEDRKVANRPYFSPVSLHPRLARALVNLSRVKPGMLLLDPFCGTGGVVMEAALLGAKTVGSDIDKKMVEGCSENLESLNIQDVKLFSADISEIPNKVEKVDAIASDPPYGRSATTNREDISTLYERAFKAFSQALKPGGYASVVLPQEELIDMGSKHLHLIESHAMRVHRSLTRNFCVFQKV
jgi:tRNA (guanine10-N2)-dimethyltransferase